MIEHGFAKKVFLLLMMVVSASAKSRSYPNMFLRETISTPMIPAAQSVHAIIHDTTNIISTSAITISQRHHHRTLEGDFQDYFSDLDIESLEEGAAVGGAFVLLLICICLLCCCCSMCCGGGGRGGGRGCSIMDMLGIYCCYEIFCDDNPGCFVPMGDGGQLCWDCIDIATVILPWCTHGGLSRCMRYGGKSTLGYRRKKLSEKYLM